VGAGGGLAHVSHILIWVDEGASVTYVHEAASPDESQASMHAGIVEIKVSDGASLKFVELQSWEGMSGISATSASAQAAPQRGLDLRRGRFASDQEFLGIGPGWGRRDWPDVRLLFRGWRPAPGPRYPAKHLAQHTTSDLLFKGALKGHSRSVWQGMIYVAPGAQKTDGYQANRNLILSPDARADSIPGLEILADDVRCTHARRSANSNRSLCSI